MLSFNILTFIKFKFLILAEDIFKWGIFLIVSGSFVFLISIVGYAGEISGKQYILSAVGERGPIKSVLFG